jgi:hypothetical protein
LVEDEVGQDKTMAFVTVPFVAVSPVICEGGGVGLVTVPEAVPLMVLPALSVTLIVKL